MSNISDKKTMNLHEKCLIKYLLNPLDLFYATELLKTNNEFLRQFSAKRDSVAKKGNINYTLVG